MYSVIIPAAGTGSRMGLGYNKLLYKVAGRTVIEHTVAKFFNDIKCKQIILTVSPEDQDKMERLFGNQPRTSLVIGGKTRQESIYNALELVKEATVLIHDGARPFVTEEIIDRCYEAAADGSVGAIVAVPPKDTIKQRNSRRSELVNRTIPREELVIVQTPQAFPTDVLKAANRLALRTDYVGTDDASLVENFTEVPIKIVDGDYQNIKFTTPEDIKYFEILTKGRERHAHRTL
ncbi:MAG: 2-C-methyl-D-erythritol 4-phosphate cytidylyltransferase [Turicibacter sp.]|nr:2-C-methyl-D-erythritol 4-phosphate cytidylyltransferase [Turicibacter sp.]